VVAQLRLVRWCERFVMKRRLPRDVLVMIFGPIIVALIILGLGSLIFVAEQLRSSAFGYALVVGGSIVAFGLLFFRTRPRQ
jgi:hypothetical protein